LTLPVERVDFILFKIVNAFDGKVFVGANVSHFDFYRAVYLPQLLVPHEMKMSSLFGVEEVHEEQVVCDEAAGDERILEVVTRHGVIVKAQERVEAHLFSLRLLP